MSRQANFLMHMSSFQDTLVFPRGSAFAVYPLCYPFCHLAGIYRVPVEPQTVSGVRIPAANKAWRPIDLYSG